MIISNIYQCSQSGTVCDEHDDDEPVNYKETGIVRDEHDYDEPVNYEETGRVRDEQVDYAESPLALMYIGKSTQLVMICLSLMYIGKST